MSKYTEEQLIEYIGNKYHFDPHNDDSVSLAKTPLMIAFSEEGDQGAEITEDEEINEIYAATDTESSLEEMVEVAFEQYKG